MSQRILVVALGCIFIACGGDSVGPTPTGVLNGRVVDETGAPVMGAAVEVLSGAVTAAQTTDTSGAFSFGERPVGNYSLKVVVPVGFEAPQGVTSPRPDRREWTAPALLVRQGQASNAVVVAQGVRLRTRIIPAGGSDTTVFAGGGLVAINVPAGGTATVVSVSEVNSPPISLPIGLVPAAPTVHVKFTAGNGSASAPGGPSSGAPSGSQVSVGSARLGASRALAAVVSYVTGSGPDVVLWSDVTATTFTAAGQTQTVPLTSFTTPAFGSVEVSVTLVDAGKDDCSIAKRTLREVDPSPLGSRIPLVLINGWQKDQINCKQWILFEKTDEPFAEMIKQVTATAPVNGLYKAYLFRYATYERVLAASDALASLLEQKGLSRPVLVGHSMGGLVGRGLMVRRGADAVRALVTLGTPHGGTALAEMLKELRSGSRPSEVNNCAWGGYASDKASVLPWTDGIDDLRPSGELIKLLSTLATQPADHVFTLAGTYPNFLELNQLGRLGCLLAGRVAGPNDGVVPLASAAPGWTSLRLERNNHDHYEMAQGTVDGKLFNNLRAILTGLANCSPPPSRPISNAFPLSGSVSRISSTAVDVILNPILIGGIPIAGLNASNFEIIEDGCGKRFDVSTSTGPVGIDIAFIQDLSGSMFNAITGVRNSVVAFAQDLERRNVDVRMGAVGYSGAGTIPSTPGPSFTEFLGPVQDFTSPLAFQQHVTTKWYASGGGDDPENGLEAIEYAHQRLTWRSGAARVYILITDASIHTSATNCNGRGPCTDQDLASIKNLIGASATMHVVASSIATDRTAEGGLDPWLLADAFGGRRLVLGTGGTVDLISLGVAAVIGQVVRLTFESTSDEKAWHALRIRVTLPDGRFAEIAPGQVRYAPIDRSMVRATNPGRGSCCD